MSRALEQAERQLLAPGGLDQADLERVLTHLMGPAVDAGDLYFQTLRHESWVLEDGLVRSGTHSQEQGVGIRALSGDKTGLAYTDEIVMPSLLQASTLRPALSPAQARKGKFRPGNEGNPRRSISRMIQWSCWTLPERSICCVRSTPTRARWIQG